MKKLLLVFILTAITGASLFAWEPKDLTKFPPGMDAKSWILNFGIGLGGSHIGGNYTYIPPIRVSLDKNIEIGDNKLPFFAGGIITYTGEGYKDQWIKWFHHYISMGGRFGYHFNWDVKNLDTYAVTTAGWTIYAGDNKGGSFFWGVNLGARYFVNKVFGFWVETGYNPFSWLDIGLAFKF